MSDKLSSNGAVSGSKVEGKLFIRLWNYCNVLRDDGMSYGDYVEQLTYLLFLKMDQEGSAMASPNLPFSRGTLPAGQLTMSIEDLGHYLNAQSNDGSYQGVSVLSPVGIAELHHPDIQLPGATDFYAMGWEVQQYQDVQVIGHNGAVSGYTTGMFLVPEKKLAIALVMNTYSPMLGIRVQRLPASVLRMLLGQEIIPGYEFPYMRIIYALVMLIPFLHIVGVLATSHRIRFWRMSTQSLTQMQIVRYVALPFVWNAVIAYVLLVILPTAFGVKIPVILLFQPDVGWVAIISGVFAIVWGLLRTGIVISTLRQTFERQKKFQPS